MRIFAACKRQKTCFTETRDYQNKNLGLKPKSETLITRLPINRDSADPYIRTLPSKCDYHYKLALATMTNYYLQNSIFLHLTSCDWLAYALILCYYLLFKFWIDEVLFPCVIVGLCFDWHFWEESPNWGSLLGHIESLLIISLGFLTLLFV